MRWELLHYDLPDTNEQNCLLKVRKVVVAPAKAELNLHERLGLHLYKKLDLYRLWPFPENPRMTKQVALLSQSGEFLPRQTFAPLNVPLPVPDRNYALAR